jgi:hypothetical protein
MSNGLNGTSGRLPSGRFSRGNAGGPGGNHDKRAREIKDAMLIMVAPDDVKKLVGRLMGIALYAEPKYSLVAISELFNRLFGKPREEPENVRVFPSMLSMMPPALAETLQKPPDDAVDAEDDHLEAGESEGRDHASVNGRGRLAEPASVSP